MLQYIDKNLFRNNKNLTTNRKKSKRYENISPASVKSCRYNVLIRKFNNKNNDDGAMSPSLPTLSWSRKRVSSGPAPC